MRKALVLTAALSLAASPAMAADNPGGAPAGLHFSAVNLAGRLDWQLVHMREGGAETTTGELMAAELELTATLSTAERDILDLALGWPWGTTMEGIDGRGEEMHFGNLYGVLKSGLGRPSLRFGQFVIPFGNLASYETHTRPLQSLYPQSLGIRIDRGASLEGMLGNYDWWLAGVGGNGPRGDSDNSPAVVARVARRFDLPSGTLTPGASALYGREMPRFSVLVDPLMGDGDAMGGAHGGKEVDEGMTASHPPPLLDLTDKLRVGLDLEYAAGRSLWRAELVAGEDGDGPVNGQFVQWEYALAEPVDLSLQAARWEQPGGRQVRFGGSLGWRAWKNILLRASLERRFGYTPMEDNAASVASLQVILDIPRIWQK